MITTKLYSRAVATAAHLDYTAPGSALVITLVAFIMAAGIVAMGRQPAPAAPAAAPAPIIVIATPSLSTQMEKIRIVYVIATATPAPAEPVSAPEPVVYSVQQAQPTAGPAWHADPQNLQSVSGNTSTFDPPASAVRICTGAGFGDWRDHDWAYSASPVCHQP